MADMTNIELGYALLAVILLMSLLTLVIIINVLVMKKESYRQEERFDKIVKSVNDYEEYIKSEVSKGILNIIDKIEVLNNKDKAKKPVVEKVNIVDELFEEKPTKAKAEVKIVEEEKIQE
jgi:hypothetical protein